MRDDPEIDKLTIGWNSSRWVDGYRPHDGDWERDGKAIGKNTKIRGLTFGRPGHVPNTNLVARGWRATNQWKG